MKQLILTSFFLYAMWGAYGQSIYIGLQEESNVTEGHIQSIGQSYWPKFQLIDSVLYVPTTSGIYSKHLNSLADTTWSVFGFDGVPIRDFIKKGNELLAITSKNNDSLMVYSNDNGQTYHYKNASHFNDPELVPLESNTTIHQIAHNAPSFDTVLVSHHFGISLSVDTGNTWTLLTEFAPEYQYRFVEFNPYNKDKLYSTGEDGFFSSYVYASSDGGANWSMIHSIFNDCVHHIAFHPFDENTYLIGREGRISKSTDGGGNWSTFDLTPYLYVYEIKYDVDDPSILYASGGVNGLWDTVYFLRSTDAGDTWSIMHQEIPGNGNVAQVLDFEIINGGIVYFTALGGLYYLESNVVSTNTNLSEKRDFKLFPNPTKESVTIRAKQPMDYVLLYDHLGRLIERNQVNTNTHRLTLEGLNSGIYFLHIFSNAHVQVKKIIKE